MSGKCALVARTVCLGEPQHHGKRDCCRIKEESEGWLGGCGSWTGGAGDSVEEKTEPVQFWFQAQLPVSGMSVALGCCCPFFPTSHQANTFHCWVVLFTAWS